MKDRGSIILNASSVQNKRAAARASIQCASKAAVRTFARNFCIRAHLAKFESTRSPAIVRTSFGANSNLEADNFDGMLILYLPGHLSAVQRQLARFLAPEDSSYVTASDVMVDGGFGNVQISGILIFFTFSFTTQIQNRKHTTPKVAQNLSQSATRLDALRAASHSPLLFSFGAIIHARFIASSRSWFVAPSEPHRCGCRRLLPKSAHGVLLLLLLFHPKEGLEYR